MCEEKGKTELQLDGRRKEEEQNSKLYLDIQVIDFIHPSRI